MIFGDNENTESMRETLASLEAQLIALYDEKGKMGTSHEMQEMIASLEEQLKSLYAEKEFPSIGDSFSEEAIKSLEEQVICLTNEKMDLESKLNTMCDELNSMHIRTRSLGAAMFEAAVFGGSSEIPGKIK